MTEAFLPIRLVEVVDLAVVWVLVWAAIAWLRTMPARLAFAGLGILVAFYLLARLLGLVLTTWILQGFAAAGVLIAIVVFQQDLRRLFEQIAAAWFRRRVRPTGPDVIDTIVRAVAHLAEDRWGALLVVPGREPVEAHVEGGLELDAHITEPLLLSLFDPHSAGHDGAVIVAGDRAVRFAVHLPLSTNHAQLGQRGTRHAAALGLAERTDALCIVVSEERGTVSVAAGGRLRTLRAPHEASDEIRGFLGRLAPPGNERAPRIRRVLERWREGLLALPVAALLWLLAVPGATVIEIERKVDVSVNGIPAEYELEKVEPPTVRVTLSGRRRDLYFLGPEAVEVRVDALFVELGRRTFTLTPANVRCPEVAEVRTIEPDSVRISLRERQKSPTEAPRPPGPGAE
jgi:diadenylate cyclase